jgi:hypothetical protein
MLSEPELYHTLTDLSVGVFERVWRVRAFEHFGEWCERNIIISPEENADYAGPYSRELVLPQSKLFELFLESPEWEDLSITKGSQAAVSAHALMAICKRAVDRPTNVIYVLDSADAAADMARRLEGFAKGVPALAEIIDETPANEFKGKVKRLPGMTLWFVGAGSAGQVAGKPGVGLRIVDERDKYKALAKETADTPALVRDRGKVTGEGSKQINFSSPTLADGGIWSDVQLGSGHRFFVPCLVENGGCGEYQYLKLAGLSYEHLRDGFGELDLARVRTETSYQCEHCHRAIEEGEKPAMLAAGEWRPTHYEKRRNSEGEEVLVPRWKPGRMSAYLNDLTARWEGSRWGDIALEKADAKRNPEKLQALLNGRLGEAWVQGASRKVTVEDIFALRKPYPRGGEVPNWFGRPYRVTMQADTQDDLWKAVISVWSERGDQLILDWGLFLSWRDLVAFGKRGAGWAGERLPAMFNLVDEGGHRTKEVRAYCAGLRPIFNPSKGRGGLNIGSATEWKPYKIDPHEAGDAETVDVLVYHDDIFKWMLYKQKILGNAKLSEEDGRLFFPQDTDREFALEFTREHRVKKNGRWQWEGEGGNDFGDAVKMGYVAWSRIGKQRGRSDLFKT